MGKVVSHETVVTDGNSRRGGFQPRHNRRRLKDESAFARKAQSERRRLIAELAEDPLLNVDALNCASCQARCAELSLPTPKTFASLPKRAIDQSTAVKVIKYSCNVSLSTGSIEDITRKGGIERHYRLLCTSCQAPVAYAVKPVGPERKILYFCSGKVNAQPMRRSAAGAITRVAPQAAETQQGEREELDRTAARGATKAEAPKRRRSRSRSKDRGKSRERCRSNSPKPSRV